MYQAAKCCDYRFVYHFSAPRTTDFAMALQGKELLKEFEAPASSALLEPLEAIKRRQHRAPQLGASVALRRSGPAVQAALRMQPGRPLLPNVFALALMPRSASQYVPAALQHLMHEGSPVADLYRVRVVSAPAISDGPRQPLWDCACAAALAIAMLLMVSFAPLP